MGFGIFILILCLIYLFLMLKLWWQWEKLASIESSDKPLNSVSILIAMRNEEDNIDKLLTAISTQKNIPEQLQIIIIDDHSEDKSIYAAEQFKVVLPGLKIIKQNLDLKGKKAALQYGLNHCDGEIILCTDADCIPGPDWVNSMSSEFNEERLQMLSAAVFFQNKIGFFNRWMELEFMALVTTGGASFGSHYPLMCNGANVAYRKSALIATGGFTTDDGFESGDDIKRMLDIHKLYPDGLKFLKDKKVIVKTAGPSGFAEFLQQRLRWSSKTGKYFSSHILFYAGVVGLMNLCLVFTLIISLINPMFIPVFLLVLIFKSLADLPMLKSSSIWAERPGLIFLLLPAEIINAFYVLLMVLIAPFSKYKWKGRKLS